MGDLFRKIYDLIGFSLLELMIIFFLIGGLAAVTIPIYNGNTNKARLCEADANLCSIRTQLRVYSSKHGNYPITNPASFVVGATWNDMQHGEISGKYFSDSSYTYLCTDGSSFTITCKSGSTPNSVRTLNQSGTLTGEI
ncbi:MAG: hypothetical protein U9Q77_08095 [Candidatus Marinimicrobia bacterium]|nr:hypothetical protein [Candidatus Neomarinimicrobiota bacterium]